MHVSIQFWTLTRIRNLEFRIRQKVPDPCGSGSTTLKFSVLIRKLMEAQVRGNQPGSSSSSRPAANIIPPILNRRFEVWYKPSSSAKVVPIRDIKASYIGKLISLKVREIT
jgi:hypothetical protein